MSAHMIFFCLIITVETIVFNVGFIISIFSVLFVELSLEAVADVVPHSL